MSDAAYSIGWWVESADEETYGPASRSTVQQLLRDGVISKNTLVRHCTQEAARPAADQPGMLDDLEAHEHGPATGDRLADFWPRSSRERRALAESDLPCARHQRPAVAVCLRCHAPYCTKCQTKPLRKPFYFCRHCQANHSNRRVLAWFLDSVLMYAVMIPFAAFVGFAFVGDSEEAGAGFVITQLLIWGTLALFVVRDSLLGGAGPGKRALGLTVVQAKDGTSPLTHGQAIVRFLPLLIPFVPLVEAFLLYRDPLVRRLGDRWAKTRVIDTPRKLVRVRDKVNRRLANKGVEPVRSDQEDRPTQFALFGG